MRDLIAQIFAAAQQMAGTEPLDKLSVVKAYEATLRKNGIQPLTDIVIYENVLSIFDQQYSARQSDSKAVLSPKQTLRALNDQKPERLHSGPSLTLLGSTNRNTTIDTRAMVSPINCSRPTLFPTTMTVEEAYQDSPNLKTSY